MISDVDIKDWQKEGAEACRCMPACGWLFLATPFLMVAMANEYIWSRYSMYARDIGAQRICS
jgi:hypothetical protein